MSTSTFWAPVRRLLLLCLTSMLWPLAARAQAPAWQQVLGLGPDSPICLTYATVTDAAGNVYIGGSFQGRAQFGTIQLTAPGQYSDGFVAKWNPATASFVWAVRLGGSGSEYVTSLAVGAGGIYVGGVFDAGNTVLGTIALTNRGGPDGFVAKLLDTGAGATVVWAQSLGSPGDDTVAALAVSGNRVYLGGYFSGTAEFGVVGLASAGQQDGYAAALLDAGTTGSFQWATRFGSTQLDRVLAVAASGTRVYVAGSFAGTVPFGTASLTSQGGTDGFLTRLTDTGTAPQYDWTVPAGSHSGNDEARGLAVQGANVYVSGIMAGTSGFGPIFVTGISGGDGYVAKVQDQTTRGLYIWAQCLGGPGADATTSLAVQGSAVYAAGWFTGSNARFGFLTATSAGQRDVFVTRLNDAGATVTFNWVKAGGGAADDTAMGVGAGPTGEVYVGGVMTPPASFDLFSFVGTGVFPNAFFSALIDPLPTATAQPASALALSVYPNPARELVTVPSATAATELLLVDAVGRVVRQGRGAVLDVRGIAPGLYLLRAAEPGKPSRTARVVVE